MSATAQLDISIIVACRNESKHIVAFLESLGRQDLAGVEWEAIIADGKSDDGTRDLLASFCASHPRIRFIDNERRIVSTGLNRAIAEARGRYILRMDAHTVYAPDYCRRCLEVIQRTGADNVGGAARTRTTGYMSRAVAAAYHSRFSTGGARFHDPDFEGFVDTVPYGCWKKSKLEELGLFDVALVRNQDDELNLRLTRSGGKIWQSKDIVSYYSPRASLRSLFHQYCQYGFWKVAVMRKHRIPGSIRHLVPVLFVLYLFAIPFIISLLALFGAPVREVFLAWALLLCAYVACCFAASFAAARQHGMDLLPVLPAVFSAYHVSYGLGFLAGLASSVGRDSAPQGNSETVFSRVTR